MALGQIIRKRREELKLTLDEVGSRTGFSKPYLSTVETGKVNNPPSDELLRKLEQVLEFDAGVLLHIAHIEKLPLDVRHQYESAEAENKKLKSLIKGLVKGKGKSRKKSKLDTILEQTNVKLDPEPETITPGRVIPIINKVAAGYPTDFDDLDYPVGIADDYVRCPDLHDPNAFAVRVVGDSMEPKFFEGDIVVFSPEAEVLSGDDCFVRFAEPHETTFKRVFFEKDNQVRLQPRNENYAPIISDGKRINGIYKAVVRYQRL